MPISILILTLNEEINIAQCLESVRAADEVVVLDSFSSDRTIEIAQSFSNTRVVQRRFDNWSAHQNWALENIRFRHRWVFYLDADERMTDPLWNEIRTIAANDLEDHVAFYCGRRNYFMGKWIKHAMPPGAIMRFFRPEKIRFERLVNPVPVIDGPYGYLCNHFTHYNFSKGLLEWFIKHNKYSNFEAIEGFKILDDSSISTPRLFAKLIGRDPAQFRQIIKTLSFLWPGRHFLRFVHVYFIKLGFLDGLAGFYYALLISMYEYWIEVKIREQEQNWIARTKDLARHMQLEGSKS